MGDRDRESLPSGWSRWLQVVAKLRWSMVYYGAGSTLCFALTKTLGLMGRKAAAITDWYKKTSSIRFDRRFGVETSGFVPVNELDFSDEQKKKAIQYQPTAAVTFGVLMEELGIRHSEYTFVDFGSGKGRALILAAHFPFRRVVGVELSPSLTAIAERNTKTLRLNRVRCREFEIVCADATAFQLPEGPLVVYLFHPFTAPVLEKVLENIRQSLRVRRRHVVVVYQYPVGLDSVPDCRMLLEKADYLSRSTRAVSDPGWDVFESIEIQDGDTAGRSRLQTVR